MASLDIGIDLGTSTVVGADSVRGIVLREPAVIAVDTRSGKVRSIGTDVYKMIGRTPGHIQVIRPLEGGVISDYHMTEVLMRYLLQKMCSNALVKPRLAICVPGGITGVESQAVVKAAVAAGARNVYLIEEPVAAAIGAGVDISRPNGNLIVDIGGGTTDIAVLSLNGIVCKTSLKTAGNEFDQILMKYIRSTYNLLIGEKTAEQIKQEIGTVIENSENCFMDVKGRDLLSGMPKKILVERKETCQVLQDAAMTIVRAVQGVLERTPPELVGDIQKNGLILTGGGALLDGLCPLLEKNTKVSAQIAENPQDCVALGTGKSFQYLDKLFDGFLHMSTHRH